MDVQFNKMEALSKFLGESEHGIVSDKYDESLFIVGDDEYLVLTAHEANSRCSEDMIGSLWAFRASFLIFWMPCCKDMSQREVEAFEECLKQIQEKLCEGATPLIKSMLGDNLDDCLDDAISRDGRGHFLSKYDGYENEQDGFFIYKN